MTSADDGLAVGRSPGRRELQDGQVSRVVVHDVSTGEGRVVHVSDRLLESPNWTPDGGAMLVVSGGGHLHRLPVAGGGPERIETAGVARLLDADGGEPVTAVTCFGGQGTLNVDGWSPDGTAFADIDHPARASADGRGGAA